MSTTGLEVFDKTLQITNIWLDEIMMKIGPIAGRLGTHSAPSIAISAYCSLTRTLVASGPVSPTSST
jgi:hypothetical protein